MQMFTLINLNEYNLCFISPQMVVWLRHCIRVMNFSLIFSIPFEEMQRKHLHCHTYPLTVFLPEYVKHDEVNKSLQCYKHSHMCYCLDQCKVGRQ